MSAPGRGLKLAVRGVHSVWVSGRPGVRTGARIETTDVTVLTWKTLSRPGVRTGARIETAPAACIRERRMESPRCPHRGAD